MTKKITFFTISIVITFTTALAAYYAYTSPVRQDTTTSDETQTDTTLGQYGERPNAATSPENTKRNTMVDGCALRFSSVPVTKVIPHSGQITYHLTIFNQGKETCRNTSFSVYYGENEKFISSSPAPSASNYYWSIGNLSSSLTKTFTISTNAVEGTSDQISNEACATADNGTDVCADTIIFIQDGATAEKAATTYASSSIFFTAGASSFPNNIIKRESGVWIWDTPTQMTRQYMEQAAEAASKNGFTSLYVTIDNYLDIANMPEGATKKNEKAKYMKTLSDLITIANSHGLAVDVEGGAKDWAEPTNTWKGYALIDFVKEYNIAYPQTKIRGLQYDVESYLDSAYQNNKEKILLQFLSFIDASVTRMQTVNANFTVVIPHFYDKNQAWTPIIKYNNQEKYAYSHLLDILQKKKGSSVIIMAYRNYFAGDNGTEQISLPEIDEATKGGYGTKVIIAQETGNVEPEYVTYHGLTRQDLKKGLDDINNSYKGYSGFGGTAVHYLDPFLQLK